MQAVRRRRAQDGKRLRRSRMHAIAITVLGSCLGIVAAAASSTWCRRRRRTLAEEDRRAIRYLDETGDPTGTVAEWASAVEQQARLGMVEPETTQALAARGLVSLEPGNGEPGAKLTLRLRNGLPVCLLWCCANALACGAVATVTGSPALAGAAACACMTAACDWAHRSIPATPCVAMVGLGGLGAGLDPLACLAAALVALAALAGFRALAESRSEGALGTGDVLLIAAMAASLMDARRLLALSVSAVAVLGALLVAKAARGTRGEPVALAPWLLLPYLIGVCA